MDVTCKIVGSPRVAGFDFEELIFPIGKIARHLLDSK
jgi:hypothetical protein